MSEEEKGFTVKDHRAFTEDGDTNEGAPQEKAENQAKQEPAGSGPGPGEAGPLPPVEFSALVLSLSHAAMMHLGAIGDPGTGEAAVNLPLARHTIDTIAMLREKTEGNLDEDEQKLIDHVVTDLRMAFVQKAK